MKYKIIIEAAAGSKDKFRYDSKSLKQCGLSQVSTAYPYPYGFILNTYAADGDGVDCYVITHKNLKPGQIISGIPIGLLEMIEDGEIDHKVIVKLPDQDVPITHTLKEELSEFIQNIFSKYPEAKIELGDILPVETALDFIDNNQETNK